MLVAGATGYIGRRLVAELVAAGHGVRCLARTPAKLDGEPWRDAVEVVAGDVLDAASLDAAFAGIEVAYYLVHSIGATAAWEDRDRHAAEQFRDAAARAGCHQLIYLGGLGDDAGQLSTHLGSRHEVGRILGSGPVPLTELRAAVVIGAGSASFEMLRHLVEVLPIMTTPRWVNTRVQPIAVTDVLTYLLGVLDEPAALGRTFEIGGADACSYRDLMQCYAAVAGLRRRIILPVPVLTPRLSSLWVGLVTPLPPELARPLIDSLVNEVVVRDPAITEVVHHTPLDTRAAITAALASEHTSSWREAEGHDPAAPMPTDPAWAGAVTFSDTQQRAVTAPPATVFAEITSLGGTRGWLAGDALWSLRGLIDRGLGGPGMRRGRRHATELRVGDTVDCWRVEALEPERLVRLRAEMRLPGRAWLEWELAPTEGGTLLTQRARFQPRGLWGRMYWYGVAPFHRLIFGPLASRLQRCAEQCAEVAAARTG